MYTHLTRTGSCVLWWPCVRGRRSCVLNWTRIIFVIFCICTSSLFHMYQYLFLYNNINVGIYSDMHVYVHAFIYVRHTQATMYCDDLVWGRRSVFCYWKTKNAPLRRARSCELVSPGVVLSICINIYIYVYVSKYIYTYSCFEKCASCPNTKLPVGFFRCVICLYIYIYIYIYAW